MKYCQDLAQAEELDCHAQTICRTVSFLLCGMLAPQRLKSGRAAVECSGSVAHLLTDGIAVIRNIRDTTVYTSSF